MAEVNLTVSSHEQNLSLKKELQERGYYVSEVNRGNGIEYIIVSTAPPENKNGINLTSN